MSYSFKDKRIIADELSTLDKEDQIEVMKEWFFERYDDPVNRCPYDEGEYVYIFGGPYDAGEELENEFAAVCSDEALDELIEELRNKCWEWSAVESPDWRDDDYYDVEIALNTKDHFVKLHDSLAHLEELSQNLQINDPEQIKFQQMMTYSFCASCLEAYLLGITMTGARNLGPVEYRDFPVPCGQERISK